MFTGLVEDTGEITAVKPRGNGVELTIRTRIDLSEVQVGDSIACNGCCLTVESFSAHHFVCTAGRETMEKTTLGNSRAGRRIHLERALRVGDRLGGHLVQGHVDGVGQCVSVQAQRESTVLWFEVPEDLARYVAAKGSICIDGVSLTVNEISGRRFRVNIVPHTVEVTRMGALAAGDPVNLEVDILAKYVERMLSGTDPTKPLTLAALRGAGF